MDEAAAAAMKEVERRIEQATAEARRSTPIALTDEGAKATVKVFVEYAEHAIDHGALNAYRVKRRTINRQDKKDRQMPVGLEVQDGRGIWHELEVSL